MPRPQWTRLECRIKGRKGGLASGKARQKTAKPVEWKAGYAAGWVACERFYTRQPRGIA